MMYTNKYLTESFGHMCEVKVEITEDVLKQFYENCMEAYKYLGRGRYDIEINEAMELMKKDLISGELVLLSEQDVINTFYDFLKTNDNYTEEEIIEEKAMMEEYSENGDDNICEFISNETLGLVRLNAIFGDRYEEEIECFLLSEHDNYPYR